MIHNPILKGFHPDPSIVRVGEDYYIATSTFEWWPGIRLHHSTDLVHWELIEYPLNRTSQLDLRGVGASQGVWAPCLTYDKGTFYLLYTVVTAFYCNMYDTNNYLVTATDIHGPKAQPYVPDENRYWSGRTSHPFLSAMPHPCVLRSLCSPDRLPHNHASPAAYRNHNGRIRSSVLPREYHCVLPR